MISLNGYGRFGLQYVEDRGVGLEDTIISSRLRINIVGTTETDQGVTFGAKLRMQWDDGDAFAGTAGNAAQFWTSYNGVTVSVGNVDTAFDSVALTYDSWMGYEASSFGDAQSSFFWYNSKYDASGALDNYNGIAVTYSISGVNLYLSYVDPDQTVDSSLVTEEFGIAADWSNDMISLAAAYTTDAGGIVDNDIAFVGAAYKFNDAGTVGLNWYDNGLSTAGDQVTLYGNYAFGATTVRAYVSDIDRAGADTAYGIGADYQFAEGVKVSGSVQSGFANETVADVGVRFDF
uniref:PORIN n=1 Tax=Fuscovulum blasticum TaxID=1075 RepID=UPI00001129C6|nr:Chain A, PORIN [Fuscovulum blasticum]